MRTSTAAIDIALPAYNCSSWIDDLLESILGQDVKDWRIVTRDDASTDSTAMRLAAWKRRLGDRMQIIDGPRGQNLGFLGNYDTIVRATTSRWVMLADSDDVWRPNKIAITLGAMKAAEAAHGSAMATVVFTDAEVVDEQLHPIAQSYFGWSRANVATAQAFRRLLIDSPAISSTMMANRAVLDLALPLSGAVCLDWWLMMVAAAFGHIVRLDERTVLYRRHSANDSLEPYAATASGAVRRLLSAPGSAREKVSHLIERIARQARAFAERFDSNLSESDLAALDAASRLPHAGSIERRWSVLRHGLWFGSFPKNVGLMLFL